MHTKQSPLSDGIPQPSAATTVPMASRLQRIGVAATTLGVPPATLRDKRFRSQRRLSARGQVIEGNGFAAAFITLGRAVFVDVVAFEEIMRLQGDGRGA